MTKLTSSKQLLPALCAISLAAGCASDAELFAEYDAWCQGSACVATELQTEIVYVTEPTLPWEPAVYFGYDRDDLNETETQRLATNLQLLQSHPDLRISLQAFTDSVASDAYNLALSERRRQRVVSYFLESGIHTDRILSTAAGKMLPVLAGDSPDARIINRRVEMMLLDSSGRPLSVGVSLPESPEAFTPPTPLDGNR